MFFFFGCQKKPSNLGAWLSSNEKIKILSTTAIIDDMVGQIGGTRVDHLTLIRGAIDPHSYELVKGDDEKLSFAQIIFHNGLGLEHGASLRYHLEKHPKGYALGDIIRQKNPNAILHDRGAIDPHIWLDVSLWADAIDPIVKALSAADPLGTAYYEKNGSNLKENLVRLDRLLAKKLKKIALDRQYLVTSHDAFNYFARRYLGDGRGDWKERFCAPEGLAPDGQLSCHDIQNVVNYMLKHHIVVIFPEFNVGRDALKKIVSVCAEKGVKVKIAEDPLYSDTLGTPGSSSGTYQKMMEHNVEALCRAWE